MWGKQRRGTMVQTMGFEVGVIKNNLLSLLEAKKKGDSSAEIFKL